eukprot:TRINITY_DN1113_c0_g1_i6.p1 TRINITY_DN1113_c0_g1~~TRINITY_DN1113_c0_g1_i6.p1  ORF type:complete len:320 (-),score=53.29 TRINITY_DN1113_c0_g1_i6:97-993(-)
MVSPRVLCAVLCLVFITCVDLCRGYLPVVMYHGWGGSSHDFANMTKFIQQSHPGTFAFSLPLFQGEASEVTPMWTQIEGMQQAIANLTKENPQQFAKGYHLMCHSQGALACRAYVMKTPNHGVVNLISLSGPHMGQYGAKNLVPIFPNTSREDAWAILYTPTAQKHFTAAGYWNDPFHQERFLEYSTFLPVLNNYTNNPDAAAFKFNFLQVKKVYLFGGPQDGVIAPWQSAFFGFFHPRSDVDVLPMEEQAVYTGDYFGLRTLASSSRLVATPVANVEHVDWILKQTLFTTYLEPLLI